MNASVVVPVYLNEDTIPELLIRIREMARAWEGGLEGVFVVDGSPDSSAELLRAQLPTCGFPSRLVLLSRNFGSFSAILAGLEAAEGPLFVTMSADLQEPASLALLSLRTLAAGDAAVVVGTRSSRQDPLFTRLFSACFWRMYRLLVQPEMPASGADMFGCNRDFRDRLLQLREANSTLLGLVYWMGFKRKEIPYERLARPSGVSGWTLSRKWKYFLDSLFAFSDLPIRLLAFAGALGVGLSLLAATVVFTVKVTGGISVPGYAATVIAVMFFGGINSLGIGLLGAYVWRAFENTKGRPSFVIAATEAFEPPAGRHESSERA